MIERRESERIGCFRFEILKENYSSQIRKMNGRSSDVSECCVIESRFESWCVQKLNDWQRRDL